MDERGRERKGRCAKMGKVKRRGGGGSNGLGGG